MAKSARVIVTGIKELDRAMRKLGNEKRVTSIAKKSMRASLKPLVATIKASLPKQSGSLKRAVKINTVRSRKAVKLAISVLPKNMPPGKAGQAAAVEFGTEQHHVAATGEDTPPGQEPQAPFRKAFDAGAEGVKSDCLKRMTAGILDAKST